MAESFIPVDDFPDDDESRFGPPIGEPANGNGTQPVMITPTPFIWRDPASVPPRRWVYGRHHIRQFVSATVAPPGVGKTSLIFAEGLAIATGQALLGIRPTERARVWLWNGEDPRDEIDRRIIGAAMHYGLTEADLAGWLFTDSGRESEIVIAEQTRNGVIIAQPVIDALIDQIRSLDIGVVAIDPFVSSHRVTENDNNAIERVVKTWARIADITGCAVELVHHSRKTGGAETTVEDARGASALIAAARSARTLNVMTEDEAARAGVENRRLYFRTDNGKSSMAPPADRSDWYRLHSVDLDNGENGGPGDHVGVTVPWKWPDPFADVTTNHLREVQDVIRAGDWAENIQAANWAGHAVAQVLGLDLDSKTDKAKAKDILKRWIANGVLRVEKRHDPKKGRDKPMIVVGENVDASPP